MTLKLCNEIKLPYNMMRIERIGSNLLRVVYVQDGKDLAWEDFEVPANSILHLEHMEGKLTLRPQ